MYQKAPEGAHGPLCMDRGGREAVLCLRRGVKEDVFGYYNAYIRKVFIDGHYLLYGREKCLLIFNVPISHICIYIAAVRGFRDCIAAYIHVYALLYLEALRTHWVSPLQNELPP